MLSNNHVSQVRNLHIFLLTWKFHAKQSSYSLVNMYLSEIFSWAIYPKKRWNEGNILMSWFVGRNNDENENSDHIIRIMNIQTNDIPWIFEVLASLVPYQCHLWICINLLIRDLLSKSLCDLILSFCAFKESRNSDLKEPYEYAQNTLVNLLYVVLNRNK